MGSGDYKDSPKAPVQIFSGSENKSLVSDAAQKVKSSAAATEKVSTVVSLRIQAEAMDGGNERTVVRTVEVEESAPPSPTVGPTPNFDQVASGIYRSSFPRLGNFEHLRSLGLKTILTLVGHDYPDDNVKFLKENGIKHFQISLPAHKDPNIKIPTESVQKSLQIILDRQNHPILIHCNKGKHRTGCIVACYRKLHDVPLPQIITEYRKYASNKARALDEKFIEEFDETKIMEGLTKSTMIATFTTSTAETAYKSLMWPTPPPSTKDGSLRDGHERDDCSPASTRTLRGDSKASERSLQ